MTNDLTRGKPLKLILRFMIPIFIGNVFQQLYNMVDTVIVGRTVSSDALAGVGATGALSFLVLGFVIGLTGGFAVMTSQCFGAGDEEKVRKSVGTSLVLCVILSVILTVASALAVKPLLRLMRTPTDIFDYAYDYIFYICLGISAMVLYNITAGIVRGLGDSTSPLIFLIIASAINIGLDFLFIMVFKMGVKGAAFATVISQGLSGIMCMIYMFAKFPVLRLKANDFRFGFNWAWRHLIIGLPMAFQFSITALGVMIQQFALNTLGTTVVTAYAAANKIDNLSTQTFISLGTAMATYCGQNYGAGKYERIKSGVNAGIIISAGCLVVSMAVTMLLGGPLTYLFMSEPGADIVNLSRRFLLYQGAFYVFLAAIFLYRNSLQGMGRSAITMIAGAIELAMRALAAFVMVRLMGFTGVCLSNPVAWLGATVFLVAVYYTVIHKCVKSGSAYPAASGASGADAETAEQPCDITAGETLGQSEQEDVCDKTLLP